MARSWEVRLAACVQLLEVACTVSSLQGCLAPQLSFWPAEELVGVEVAEGEVLVLAPAEVENALV